MNPTFINFQIPRPRGQLPEGPGSWLALLIPVGMVAGAAIILALLYVYSKDVTNIENELNKASYAEDFKEQASKLSQDCFQRNELILLRFTVSSGIPHQPDYRTVIPCINPNTPIPHGVEIYDLRGIINSSKANNGRKVAVCEIFNKKMLELISNTDKK